MNERGLKLEINKEAKEEEQILEFWKKEKIYEKSVKKNSKGKKFYLMDGPPYATGHIHMGTALNKILKDIAMRSRRLQGFNVFDRAGYDTHGVPIEYQIEKEIGSKNKQDIEKFGVKKFIEKCKEFATQYIDVMNSEFVNLGVWMNFKEPYLTLTDDYIETIWDTFKVADQKGLLYLGKYPVHVCPRCETAVAYNEIEYSKQEDTSVFVRFPLINKEKEFLVIWTTTPWTLPANTGIMVHPEIDYQKIELSSGEKWVMAKELVPKLMTQWELGYKIVGEFKGKEMKGWQYKNPLSKYLDLKTKNAYKVVLSARYVNLEEGTGLVHCAPGHGKEDYEVGKEFNLDMPSPVDINGNLTKEAGKYAGKKARVVDEEIIKDLENDGFLVHKIKYSHDYPLCWRCKSPLLMIALPQWFLKISDIHKRLLEENEKTNWIPGWMKQRMKAWLEGISDWPVSRMRYWGTPLPIWVCEKCKEKIVVGSINELKKLSKEKEIGVHKPEIDKIMIPCKCGSKMKRVPEVLDVWFDSGVSSWAALKAPANIKKYWPADINIEGKDQIRGWWNSQLILSMIKFGKKPFENISVHGMVLDLEKRKMSKSYGNVVSPQDVIEKYCRDYMRHYFAKVSRGEDLSYNEKEFVDIEAFFRIFRNINNFINQTEKGKSKMEIEDKWILSKFNSLIKKVTESYNNYRFYEVIQELEKFLIFDLSRTYIKLIRERADETYEILNEIRIGLLKIFAPICPFVTEKIWQELREKKIVKEESVHLSEWPELDEKKIDNQLEKSFERIFEIIEKGLAERDKLKIGLRWPLKKATVTLKERIDLTKFKKILLSQLNVKDIELQVGSEFSIVFDATMTPELEAEGYAREISRWVQAKRKKEGLVKKDKIVLKISGKKEFLDKISGQKEAIKERINAKEVILSTEKINGEMLKIKDYEVEILFNKI
ncbi:MAG: isoleucine--tRNA ligase [Candidatus Pacearchaeota archaeon]